MHKKFLTWLWLFGFAALLCFDAHAQGAGASAPGQIRAAKVTGTVTATKDGSTITLKNGTELTQGYTINTAKNSSVVLVFSNGATLNLAQDTLLAIDEFTQDPFAEEVSVSKLTAEPTASKTKLNLSRGELVGNVKKLNYDAGSTFNIQTPVGAAGIRGTTFRIVFTPTGDGKAFFSLTTLEGNVVLAAGSVNLPNETSVPDNKEVEVIIDVQVDASGALVLIVGSAPPVVIVKDASAITIAQLATVVQQIATATSDITFGNVTTSSSGTPPAETPTETKEEPPPPVIPPAPRTTTGDGG